jgi:octaprenyl-diphosphate synthase
MNTSALRAAISTDSELFFDRLLADINAVEAILREQMNSQVPLVQAVGLHTLGSGGKRLRPAFLLVAARATLLPFDLERAYRLGACMEMIHMATLIHDDVIDHADIRRGQITASAKFGNTSSILSGDVLLSKAMAILARDGDIDIIRVVADSVVQIAEGEVAELLLRNDPMITLEQHLEVLHMKTASFVECCCTVGAKIAKADSAITEGLAHYGANVGIAFQIIDDALDYQGDPEITGKTKASDFVEGCATMPLLLALTSASAEDKEYLMDRFGGPCTAEEISRVLEIIDQNGGFAGAREIAANYVAKALEALETVPESRHKQAMIQFSEFVLARNL